MNRFSSPDFVPTPCHLLNKNAWCHTEVLAGDEGEDGGRNLTGENNDAKSLKSEVEHNIKVT